MCGKTITILTNIKFHNTTYDIQEEEKTQVNKYELTFSFSNKILLRKKAVPVDR